MKLKTIDLLFQGHAEVIASYIIESGDGLIMIETGPGSVIDEAKDKLSGLGYAVKDVKHVFVTHIHLDHAGAAGWWAQQGAKVYVHHVGARHLVDPSRLMASASRIYGDQMDVLWGEMLPVPENNLVILKDDMLIEIGNLQIRALDTPGHAYHHMSYLIDDIAFTGDVGGATVPEFGLVDAATPPPEFNLEAWLQSIERLRRLQLREIYLTHFGRVSDVDGHLSSLRELLVDAAEFVKIRYEAKMPVDEIASEYGEWYQTRVLEHGVPQEVFETLAMSNQPGMSVGGITRYWRKLAEAQAS